LVTFWLQRSDKGKNCDPGLSYLEASTFLEEFSNSTTSEFEMKGGFSGLKIILDKCKIVLTQKILSPKV